MSRLKRMPTFAGYETDSLNAISDRISQLQAMLTVCGAENFNTWHEEIKQNYLWACSVMLDDLEWHFRNPDKHLKEAVQPK